MSDKKKSKKDKTSQKADKVNKNKAKKDKKAKKIKKSAKNAQAKTPKKLKKSTAMQLRDSIDLSQYCCDGCKKHCPLNAPKCGKGRKIAAQLLGS